MAPFVIYCADGGRQMAEIAVGHKLAYGARLPNTVYPDPVFSDQDWQNPDLEKYLAALGKYRPGLATVLDWERSDQLPEVLAWAEAVASLVDTVIIIPKVIGGIERIPNRIGGRPVRLGYSVPTGFSGTPCHIHEFGDRPVHLLGGSPLAQRWLTGKMPNVASADGNYMLKMAIRHNQYFVHDGSANFAKHKHWPTLREVHGKKWGDGSNRANAPYEAFSRSCENLVLMWQGRPPKRHYPVSLPLFTNE